MVKTSWFKPEFASVTLHQGLSCSNMLLYSTMFVYALFQTTYFTPTCRAAQLSGDRSQELDSALSYSKSIEKWRAEHEARFRSPSGWLALIGHFWLKEGENRIGQSNNDPIRLPSNLKESHFGAFYLRGDSVHLYTPADSSITVNGEHVEKQALKIDAREAEADGSDVLRIGDRITLQLVRREGKWAVRVRDSQSELLTGFQGKKWFQPNAEFCVTAKYKPREQPLVMQIKNIKGTSIDSKFSGTVEFELQGRPFTLEAITESPKKLFIIFKDKTSGSSTYAAGRFLDVDLGDEGEVVLDFNKAYQPPCAFSPHTLCPLPPKQNHLDIAIEAGERK